MKHPFLSRSQRYMKRETPNSAEGCAFYAGRSIVLRDACIARARDSVRKSDVRGWANLAREMNWQYLHYQTVRRIYDRR
jgi:hypothetical protein